MDNTSVAIILTAEEMALAELYAKAHDISLEDAFKGALLERIDDELYLELVKGAFDKYIGY